MYSKLSSIIVNSVFGIFLFFKVLEICLLMEGLSSTARENFISWLFTIVWVLLCSVYNWRRYKKMVSNSKKYDRTCFCLTLFIPLIMWLVLYFLFYVITEIFNIA